MKNNFNIAFIRFALLLVTLFQSLNVVQAQTYPVQVNVNTAGPYYNYLSYYADENFHLQAVVTLTDFNSAPVQARLRLKIEGPGYTAITKPGVVVGSTFTLSPGMPEFVKGIDLAPYFYENNLLVTPSGINLNNLPEGFTTICVEVINDSPAQEVLSTNNCTSFFLQRFQPSQLVFPACGSSVNPSEQFHTFQWTPPVGFVPSIGTEINYTFSLYEWNDPSNYNIFQTGQGLVYTTQTSNPLVQLSSFDITFQEGLTYVWRIEAQILSNGLEVNMLENNGVSSPCTFVYGEVQSLEESLADGLTIDLNTSSEGERKGRAYWTVIDNTPGEGLSTFSSFVVAYRKQPTGNEEFDLTWFEDTVSSFSQFIYQLEPSTTYEVKIAGIAGDFVSDYSEVETFTTNAPRNYACGDQDLPFRPANYTPLENALVGMIFQIGQFDMTITQITPTGSAGHYSGKGMIPVAFLGGARAKVKFDDILVDDQYLVREGQVDVVTKGVENWLSEEYLSMVDPIDVQGQITAYGFANDSTVWAVVNGDTLTWTFQNDLPIVIHGEGNVEIQYWPDGHIVVTTYDTIPSTDSLSATASLNIQFEEVVGQESYFDKKEHDHFAENYEAISCVGNYVYWVPNASRRKTESRQVKAVFHGYDEILDVSKVKFEMNGGYTIAPHTVLNDSTYLVNLPIKDFDYQLYAKYDTLKMGKLNVKSFAQVTKNIKIVPLVPLNYSSTDVSQSLTNLYQGAHVNCVVSIDSLFNTSEFNSSTVFANPEVNGMLHYTEQMRNLREAYFLNHELESDTYLVFVINEFEDASVDGYMVRGKGLGFVTQSSLTTLETFTHTLGHELGHGIGGLVHAWGDAASKKNTTDNLMDYSGGTTLTNNQWQALHNSENVFSLLDSEEDGMFGSGYAITPDFQLISVPTKVTYSFGNLNYVNEGCLTGFVLYETSVVNPSSFENVEHYYWDPINQKYKCKETNNFYLSNVVTNPLSSASLYLFYDNNKPCSQNKYVVTRVSTIKSIPNVSGLVALRESFGESNLKTLDCVTFENTTQNENNSGGGGGKWSKEQEGVDCSSNSDFILDNVGSCAFRINRSPNACLKALSTATRTSLFLLLKEHVGGVDPPTEETMFALIDQTEFEEQTSYYNGVFNDGGNFDVGYALNKLLESGLGDETFEATVRSKVEEANYYLLRKIIEKCDFSDVSYPFIEYVSSIFMKSPNFSTERENISVFDDEISYNIFLKPYFISDAPDILMSKENVLNGNFYIEDKERITMNGNGQLNFKERYKAAFATGEYIDLLGNPVVKTSFTNLTYSYGSDPTLLNTNDPIQFEKYSVDTVYFDRNQVDPFEPVIFVFTNNHNQLTIEADKLYVMPAIWGFCIEKMIQDQEDARFWRHVQNGAAIVGGTLAAPFSGGTTLAIAIAGVTAGTADEIILSIQDGQTLEEYQNSLYLYDSWEIFYQTVMIVDGLVNAPGAITSLADIVRTTMQLKFVKTMGKFLKPSYYKEVLRLLKDGVSGAGEALSFSKTVDFGGDVFFIEGQKLNILGKVAPSNGSLGTTELLFQAPANIKPNIIVLSTPMTTSQKAMSVLEGMNDYWLVTNKTHIDNIILNNGPIRFIHDPRVYDNYWVVVADLPTSNATQIAFKQKCISEGLIKFKSFLGREYDYLISKGYVLQENGLMIKP